MIFFLYFVHVTHYIYLQTISNLEFLEMKIVYDVINLLSILVIARFDLPCSSMFINKIDL